MTRLLLSTALAAALIVPVASAEAASPHRHKHHMHKHHMYRGGATWDAPVSMRRGYYMQHGAMGRGWNQTPGPPWAGPAECYEDLGYGRYESCDVRR
jgi:hypothetical protein